MKNFIFIFLLFAAQICVGQGFWKNMEAAPGGNLQQLEQLPNGILVGVSNIYLNGKICISLDTGKTWTAKKMQPYIQGVYVQGVNVGRNGTIYVTTLKSLCSQSPFCYSTVKSTDFGQTWEPFLEDSDIKSVDEMADGTLVGLKLLNSNSLACSFIKSTDSGQTWATLSNFNSVVGGIKIDDSDNIICQGHISFDGGNIWKTFRPTTDYGELPIVFDSGNYLLVEYNKLIRGKVDSTFFSYVKVDPSNNTSDPISLIKLNSGRVLATIYSYFPKSSNSFYSDDEGLTWQLTKESNGFFYPSQNAFSDSIVFLNNLSVSTNMLQTSRYSGAGIRNSFFSKIKPGQSIGELFGLNENGLWKSTDDGQDWDLLTQNLPTHNFLPIYYDFQLDNHQNPIVLTDSAIYYSANGGLDFVDISPIDFTNTAIYLNYFGSFGYDEQLANIQFDDVSNSIFIYQKQALYKSSDFGASWHKTATGNNKSLSDLYRHPSGSLFAIVLDPEQLNNPNAYSLVFKSDDEGESWISWTIFAGLPNFFGKVTGDKNGKIYVSNSTGWWPSTYYTSSDTGNTWTQHFPKHALHHFCFNSANHIIATDSVTIFRSIDEGVTWTTLPKYILTPKYNGSYFNYSPLVTGMFLDSLDRLYLWLNQNNIDPDSFFFRSNDPVLKGAFITGKLYKSNDTLCQTPDLEIPLTNWIIEAEGADDWFAKTDAQGDYTFFIDTGHYNLKVHPQIGPLWKNCPDSALVYLSKSDTTIYRDLQETALADCPYLSVEMGFGLRRCFESSMYFSYCNVGTLPTDSAWLEIELDPFLTLTDSIHNWLPLGQNKFKLFLGALDINECGGLQATIYTQCDSTVVGQVHCIEAHATPDTLCNYAGMLWSGAEIMARAVCTGDSVRFEVFNPTDVATQPLEYVIIEDDVLLHQGAATYPPNSVTNFTVAAASFVRFESQQEPNHPFSNAVAAWKAGCDTVGGWSWINQFFIDNGFPSRDVDCVPNQGSFDPNDKTGMPLGFGAEHFIRPETDLEYTIRFQNTGNAPAQTVIIRDTLSGFLDVGSLVMGASSHVQTWSLDGRGVLSVFFNDINLPDSFSNEQASQGFFSFKISQKPALAQGTLIENRAAIYFDLNDPIITNTTFHQIKNIFLKTIDFAPTAGAKPSMKISPNPTAESAIFELENIPLGLRNFRLFNALGTDLRSEKFSGQRYFFERGNLPPGIYFFSISVENAGRVVSGKLVLQ